MLEGTKIKLLLIGILLQFLFHTAQAQLTQCLQSIHDVEIYTQDSGFAYDESRTGVRVRQQHYPAAIVYASSISQVQLAVKCAVAANVKVVPRSGGHSYEGLSSLDNQLVIDISGLAGVSVNSESATATVGAGIRLGNLYVALDAAGFTFTGGTCPSVGLGGHMAGGGFGMLARKYGLLVDNVLSAKLVDAEGNLLVANTTNNDALFWAIRGGGGGSYGIVVEVTLEVFRSPSSTVFEIMWEGYQKSVLNVYQVFGLNAPPELTTMLNLNGGRTSVTGRFLGTQGDLEALIQNSGLLDIASPSLTYHVCSSLGAQAAFYDPNFSCDNVDLLSTPSRLSPENRENSKTKSDFFSRIIPDAGLQAIVDAANFFPSDGMLIQFHAFGGFMDWVNASATPYPHRNGTLMSLQYVVYFDSSPEPPNSTRFQWIYNLENALKPYVDGSHYQGYVDLDVLPGSYFGANWARLIAIKAQYDPHGLFMNPQSPLPPLPVDESNRSTTTVSSIPTDTQPASFGPVDAKLRLLLSSSTMTSVSSASTIASFSVKAAGPQPTGGPTPRLSAGTENYMPSLLTTAVSFVVTIWEWVAMI
ncbi:hypothetical protein HDU93_008766 [Gonapodya sp. JEL0774]|nr:hypothetical protein HDU93_008766 [Gonapodya sp. JEL0774]